MGVTSTAASRWAAISEFDGLVGAVTSGRPHSPSTQTTASGSDTAPTATQPGGRRLTEKGDLP